MDLEVCRVWNRDLLWLSMACLAVTLGVIILSGFISFSAANKDACDLYAAVGQSLRFPFHYDGLTNTHVLRWTHNKTIVFYRQQGRVSVGKTEAVSAVGSLLLKNLQFSSAGLYQATVLHPNGTLAQSWMSRLCMIHKVTKPGLSYVCDFKSSSVNLNCDVAKAQGLVFSWTLDEKTLPSETRQTLSVSLSQLKGKRSFTCSVANQVSKENSDVVRPACKSPPPSPPPFLCFTSQTVVAAAAGGVGLILLLLVIIIMMCCFQRRNKSQVRLGGKGDVRMLSLNKREPDPVSPEYETMHPTEKSPAPSPKPSPRACYQNVSELEAESGNRPLEVPTASEGQQPSPVPKPRTKNPQKANI